MMRNRVFALVDYLIYFFQANNRHGIHSPFVYQLAEKVVYDSSISTTENIAELCRKRMIQSNSKITFEKNTPLAMGKVAEQKIVSAKYARLLYRLSLQKGNKHIVEVGSSFAVLPLYLQREYRNHPDRLFSRNTTSGETVNYESNTIAYHVFDRSEKSLEITEFNLQKYHSSERVITHTYQSASDIIQKLHTLDEIGLFVLHDSFEEDEFWKILDWLIPRLGSDGAFVMLNKNRSLYQQQRWKQIEKYGPFTVSIDLFTIGLAFARKEQIKETFTIRY
ncbi:MAG: hypothetical protein CK532_04525 [Flavobacteriales bacterium]|nr:MAG: hypothetical protein CK532_04525 [Flavobacteriales bacterium]